MRVLVVEDEVSMAEALKQGLEREGFVVDVALDGNDGLWRARENDYDALVLDVLLPGMNGFRVCSTLRSEDNWTPILMLTAKDGDLDEAEALDTGADDFLSKPFSYVVLVARLRALLRRRSPEDSPALVAGDLRLDTLRHRCFRGDSEITLTPREFAVLEYLMRRPGEMVPKNRLLEHVWDFAFSGPSNIVEVYIGYLRKKIDIPFDRHAVETVRGLGYRVAPDGG